MALPDDLRMRLADESDLAALRGLRESVGWSAHDWAMRAVLDPSDARCFVATEPGGRIIGVGSGISYGALGFVGNMVVADDHRRRGVGAAILEEIIQFLDNERDCTRLELFATGDGRPLYARYGFVLTGPSAMATLPRRAPLAPDGSLELGEEGNVDAVSSYDAPRFGGDRRRLLAMMAADQERPLIVARRDGDIAGYAWLRPDGPRIGPFLADTPAVASTLLAEAFARLPEADELTLNLPSSNTPGSRWLTELGVTSTPWDGRMARGSEVERRDDTIYGNLVGALG